MYTIPAILYNSLFHILLPLTTLQYSAPYNSRYGQGITIILHPDLQQSFLLKGVVRLYLSDDHAHSTIRVCSAQCYHRQISFNSCNTGTVQLIQLHQPSRGYTIGSKQFLVFHDGSRLVPAKHFLHYVHGVYTCP